MSDSKNNMPTFSEVKNALEKLSSMSDASESHGLLCSLFCGGAEINIQAWVDSLMLKQAEDGDIDAKDSALVLSRMFSYTKQQFVDNNLALDILFASEDEDFEVRVTSMVSWVQGYISGLGLFGISINNGSKEIKEAVQDLIDISYLKTTYDKVEEADEKMFIELAEFIKVAVFLIYNEFSASKNTKEND